MLVWGLVAIGVLLVAGYIAYVGSAGGETASCPGCAGSMSPRALTCPHCGDPVFARWLGATLRAAGRRLIRSPATVAFVLAAAGVSLAAARSRGATKALVVKPIAEWPSGFVEALAALWPALTHALVNVDAAQYLGFAIWALAAGMVLERRTGSWAMAGILLGSAMVPGLAWLVWGEGLLAGRAGVAFGIAGGLVALVQRHRAALGALERTAIGALLLVALFSAIPRAAVIGPGTALVLIAAPAGYAIALAAMGTRPSRRAQRSSG